MKFEDFKKMAESCGGSAKDFKQSFYIKRFGSPPEVVNGVCRALSVAYLVKNYSKAVGKQPDTDSDFVDPDMSRDLQVRKFFESFLFARMGNPTASGPLASEDLDLHRRRFTWIGWVQYNTRRPHKARSIQEANDMEVASVCGAMSKIGGAMMQHKGQTRFSIPEEKASTAQFPDGQGFWFINVGAHAVAVCFRSQESGGKAKFFDPNNGQVTFSTYEECRNFMNVFMRKEYGTEQFFVHVFG